MFGWFEQRLNPFPSEVPDVPPRGLFAFCWHYTKPAAPWLIAMAILTMLIAIGEVALFQFLGDIVDWLSHADKTTFLQTEWQKLFWMGAMVLVGLPLAAVLDSHHHASGAARQLSDDRPLADAPLPAAP